MFDYTKDSGQLGLTRNQLQPHPDGQAWTKCCRDVGDGVLVRSGVCCAFVKDQPLGPRLTKDSGDEHLCVFGVTESTKVNDTPFICAHRTEDNYYRVCAGWDAVYGNKALAAKAKG